MQMLDKIDNSGNKERTLEDTLELIMELKYIGHRDSSKYFRMNDKRLYGF